MIWSFLSYNVIMDRKSPKITADDIFRAALMWIILYLIAVSVLGHW